MSLTVRDHMVLQLAAATYRKPGNRLDDALDQVGLTPTRFHAAVNRLLDHPAALATYPADVHRLRRLRDARRRQRTVTARRG